MCLEAPLSTIISLLCPFGIPGLGITFALPGKLLDLLPVSWSEEEEPLFDEDEDEDEEDSSPEEVDASTESFSQSQEGGFDSTKNPRSLRTLYRLR